VEEKVRIVEEGAPPHDSTLGFVFALLCPGLALLSVPVLEQFQSTALAFGCAAFALAHAVIAILFSIKAVEARGGCLPLFTIGLSCLMLFGALVVLPAAYRLNRNFKASCQNNLKQWGLIHKMYANEHENRYPALSPSAGQLAPDIGTLYPEYLNYLYILRCVLSADPRLVRSVESPYLGTVSDQSFYYLGYIVDSPETLRAFHDAYAKVIADGGNFESDLVVPEGLGTWGGDKILRLSDAPDTLRPGLDEQDATGPGGEAMSFALAQSRIPTMIERPGHHSKRNKTSICNVLYMDGHVEAHRYPGAWPLTEKTFALLESMDQMGPYIPEDSVRTAPDELAAAYGWIPFAVGIGVFCLWQVTGVNTESLVGVYSVAIMVFAALAISGPNLTPPGAQLEIHHPDGSVTYAPPEELPAGGRGSSYR